MTKALELAKECGIPAFGECYVVTLQSEIETFYHRAQAQALRDAIKNSGLMYNGIKWVSETALLNVAAELESKT